MPVWRPLLNAIGRVVRLSWVRMDAGEADWFSGNLTIDEGSPRQVWELVSCAGPQAEVIEALRWARELIASGRARPEEIAITAAATSEWDDHFLGLSANADLPVHFSHGLPALATWQGQACAALADVLVDGLSQDRVRRLLAYSAGRAPALERLAPDWGATLKRNAALFEIEQWRGAIDCVPPNGSGCETKAILMPVIERLARGPSLAHQAGDLLPDDGARELWFAALTRAPPQALEFSLQDVRVPHDRDPTASIAWCPANHLAGWPRPFVRLLGLTSSSWPRRDSEDPLLPDHILARSLLDPDPAAQRDRRHFEVITNAASGACVLSRSRRGAQGTLLAASPLITRGANAISLRRSRVPGHAFSETDRLLARPDEAAIEPAIASGMACWQNWRTPVFTAHDGRVRSGHPLLARITAQTHSATSLRLMLRDPLGFAWRYALGYRSALEEEQPLSIDNRSFGELVHELLKRTVDGLEPLPGYLRAARHDVEASLDRAVQKVGAEWPLVRATPPARLWEHVLNLARGMCLKALTLDESFQPGTRSWTEARFGDEEADAAPNLAWDPTKPVFIGGSGFRVRGSIDRLDLNVDGHVRVSDYKTGTRPNRVESLVLGGGGELQRTIYAAAVRQLLGGERRVIARLLYLGDNAPQPYRLKDVDTAITQLASLLRQGRALVESGKILPGIDAWERWNDFRLAQPANLALYRRVKQGAFAQAFGEFAKIWSVP
jgi:hypothetical protein